MAFRTPALTFCLFCLAAPFLLSLPDRIEEREGTGIEIASDPSGAEVFVDGIRKGKTPLSLTDLRPGAHRLEVLKDGYRNREEMILVRERGRLSIFLQLKATSGRVAIRVRPAPGSEAAAPLEPTVTIDGGRKEIGVVELSAGVHSVRVRAFGWEDQVRSVTVETDSFVEVEIELVPAEFRLSPLRASRRRFNPLDKGELGSVAIQFEASAPGSARVTISPEGGREAVSFDLGPFTTWEQQIDWDGRDADGEPLPDGEYEVVVRAESVPPMGQRPVAEVRRLSIFLNSAVGVRPASLSSGVAGALYAPQARLLPERSFQLEGSLLFGSSYEGAAGASPPFAFGARFSPAEGWEAGAAVNLVETENEEASSAFALSLRRSLASAKGGAPFSAALALRYGWAAEEDPAPYALPRGVAVDFPLEAGAAGDRGWFFVLSPGLRLGGAAPGGDGNFAVLAAAAGRRSEAYVAALSAGTERALSAEGDSLPILIGAECRFNPPPSTLVYGLIAGARVDGDERGFFGGLCLGFIY